VVLAAEGGLGQAAEERVHSHPVPEVPVVPVSLVGDPGEVVSGDPFEFGQDRAAQRCEEVVLGKTAPAELLRRPKRADDFQIS
jgi:hypothetical protein